MLLEVVLTPTQQIAHWLNEIASAVQIIALFVVIYVIMKI